MMFSRKFFLVVYREKLRMVKSLSCFLGMLACCLLTWGSPCQAGKSFYFDPAPLLQQARTYLDEGQFLECVEAYEQVAKYASSPREQVHALVRMGDVLSLFLEQKHRAVQVYNGIIQRFGPVQGTENAYFNRAMILYEQRQLPAAEQGFRAYTRMFPQGQRRATADFMVEQIREERRQPAKPQPEAKSSGSKASGPAVFSQTSAGSSVPVRVALATRASITLHAQGGGKLMAGGTAQTLAGNTLDIRASGNTLSVNGKSCGRRCVFEPAKGLFAFNGKNYQGKAVVSVHKGKVLLVNTLPVEAYLRGVLPREMMASWDEEALCAQAVAARTYALYLREKSQDKPYDVAATTASQVYGGADAATSRTDRAVARTAGQVLVFDGKPVLSYFHSHSGGMLEDPAKVWTTGMPYYQIKDDGISQQFHPVDWTARISAEAVKKALVKHGFHVGAVQGMRVQEVSPSGRWVKVRISTDTGPVDVKGNSLRIWLGAGKIKSTLGTISQQGRGFVFAGKGFGHGVGLSQWGAQGMAKKGSSYNAILAHYYPGTTISKLQ